VVAGATEVADGPVENECELLITDELVASADEKTLRAFVVVGASNDITVRSVVDEQGVRAQERMVRALMLPVLVLVGLEREAEGHSLDSVPQT
jgi:hypothetical protein